MLEFQNVKISDIEVTIRGEIANRRINELFDFDNERCKALFLPVKEYWNKYLEGGILVTENYNNPEKDNEEYQIVNPCSGKANKICPQDACDSA